MANLLFPNTEKVVSDEELAEVDRLEKEEIQRRIDLLKEEKRLERERIRRLNKNRKATEKNLRRQQRMKQALAMRLRNHTIDQIAAKLHVSTATVGIWLRECFAAFPDENTESIKKVLNRNLGTLLKKFHEEALEGCDPKMADVALKSINQIAKISGLNIQRREVEQTNLGEVTPGVELAELNLDLETKKKLLQAIREKRQQEQAANNKNSNITETEQELEDEDVAEEEGLDENEGD